MPPMLLFMICDLYWLFHLSTMFSFLTDQKVFKEAVEFCETLPYFATRDNVQATTKLSSVKGLLCGFKSFERTMI